MSDGNTDTKGRKAPREPILHLSLRDSIKLIFKITYLTFLISFLYVFIVTPLNVQPFEKMLAKTSGYFHYQENKDLFSEDNIERFFEIYIYEDEELSIGELKLISPDFESYGITYDNISRNRLYELSEDEFAKFIEYIKVVDRLDGEVAISPCQLYSYLWAQYYDYNAMTYKYHFIEGHTFIIVEKPFGYSIVEQQEIMDVHLSR